MKIKFFLLTSLAMLISVIGTARADDTDIYINNNATLPANSMPMVMFSLDYRPNLGSTACGQGQDAGAQGQDLRAWFKRGLVHGLSSTACSERSACDDRRKSKQTRRPRALFLRFASKRWRA